MAGTLSLWDGKSFRLLLALCLMKAPGDWLVVSPEGLFDGSEGATKLLAFYDRQTGRLISEEEKQRYSSPGLTQRFLPDQPK
jgi:hypothetical protein